MIINIAVYVCFIVFPLCWVFYTVAFCRGHSAGISEERARWLNSWQRGFDNRPAKQILDLITPKQETDHVNEVISVRSDSPPDAKGT